MESEISVTALSLMSNMAHVLSFLLSLVASARSSWPKLWSADEKHSNVLLRLYFHSKSSNMVGTWTACLTIFGPSFWADMISYLFLTTWWSSPNKLSKQNPESFCSVVFEVIWFSAPWKPMKISHLQRTPVE